jgi:transcription elongation factor GreA-like protein
MGIEELYPENFDTDDKIRFDMLVCQSIQLYPQLEYDDWLIKLAVIDHIQKERGRHKKATPEFVEAFRKKYENLPNVYHTPTEENTITIE